MTNTQKYRWLKHSVQGAFSQSSLMVTIVEFALKEEPLDVEKMRKCLLKQVKQKQYLSIYLSIYYNRKQSYYIQAKEAALLVTVHLLNC